MVKKALKITLFILLPVVLIVIAGRGMHGLAEQRLEKLLAGYGFEHALFQNVALHKDGLSAGPITLDPDEFSRLGTMRAQINGLDFILNNEIEQLTLNDLLLTGEIKKTGLFTFAGWNGIMPPLYPPAQSMTLNRARIDLMTDSGALQFEANGQITRKNDTALIRGTLKGEQRQLILDSNWAGTISPDGGFDITVEIPAARLHTNHVQATRINGWASFSQEKGHAENTPLALSGQIEAGFVDISGTSFSNVTLTLDGRLSDFHIIAHATLPGYPDTTLDSDITRTHNGYTIAATVSTNDLEHLLSFLQQFHTSVGKFSHLFSAFTPLMITPGNLDRLRETIKAWPYDRLELKIQGPLHDLSAKIIVKDTKSAIPEIHVVSLDPAL